MRRLTVVLACACLAALSTCDADTGGGLLDPGFVIVGVGPETQLTTDPDDQFDPAISGRLVVYSDRRGEDADVWVQDVVTGIAVPVSGVPAGDQLLGDVSGGLVVFNTYRAVEGTPNLWVCEWTGTDCPASPVADAPGLQRRAAVFDSVLVYEDDRNAQYDIYRLDLRTGVETRITDQDAHQRRPRMFGDRIVWEDFRNGNADVYTCEWDGATCPHVAVTDDPAQDVYPDVFGDWIVFGSNRASIGDIWAVNLADGLTPIPVTTGESYERAPKISGTYVSYESYEAGDSDIWLYDLATGTTWQLTTDPAEQYLHAISGTRVVFTDNRNDNLDIYMVELSATDVPEVDEIHDLVDDLLDAGAITNPGIGNALQTFLDQIAAALAEGDTAAACRRLDHFVAFVASKSGKQIDPAAADALIAAAGALLAEYCAM